MRIDLSLTGRRGIRLVRQTEMSECGTAALLMVAHYHGLEVDLGVFRRHYAPSMRGSSLKAIMSVADSLGLNSRAVQFELDRLPQLHMPAILHWNMNHFVVVERWKAHGTGFTALIHDPAHGSRWVERNELSNHATGLALELSPSEHFEPVEVRERLRLRQLWRRMSGLKRALAQTLMLTLMLQAFVLASPYFMQIAVDSAIPARDRSLVDVLAIGFGLFAIFHAAASMLRSLVLLAIGSRVGFGIAANIVRKLFRLRLDWFEKRHTGDILSRFQSILPVQQLLTTGALAALIDGTMALLILLLMFLYSVKLTAIALFAFSLYLGVRIVTFRLQRDQQEANLVTEANAQTMLIESVRGIATLRLFGKEAERHSLWQTQMVDAVNARIRLARVGIWQGTANTLIFALENVLITWLGVRFVISGEFTVGMVFAYLAYTTQFRSSVTSFIDQAVAFRMLDLHLERLGDIALASEDASFSSPPAATGSLRGRVELRGIRYRYSESDPWVLDGIDLVVKPGEHVAITGPSGCGKSTLVKIILGLVEPGAGELLVDGLPLARFGHRNYRGEVGAVLQNDTLFGGSLATNIALFDDRPDMERIIEAARAAAIHEDIARMPMQYETLVGEMGSSLSGGQHQRVLLARALYRNPRILVVDEATSHLDVETESAVNSAIRRLNMTRIVVAHRHETILAADRVVRLVNGRIEAEPA